MADVDVKKRSVTAADVGDLRGAPVFHWMINGTMGGSPGLPVWWSPSRDYYLRQTIELESFWTSAIGVAITKMSSQAWELESDQPRVRNYFQDLLLAADNNQSWVNFLSKHLSDFLCTDNGAFIEIVRATSGAGSRILGLMHLDSLRCTRTGDPDIPVIYRDSKGKQHEMRAHQVILMSDMPDSAATWFGVGHCAASRAYRGILKLAAIENYIYDKVSGKRSLAIDVVKGLSDKQIQTAMQTAKEQREAQSVYGNAYSYMGVTVIPTLSDLPLETVRLNFAELPDGFDRQQEFNISMLQYANAIGLDPQDLQPLTGAALGTGTQATVLAEKGKGKGLAAWRQQFTHNTNQFILPDSVTFAFMEKDLRDEQAQANVDQTRTQTADVLVKDAILTPAQAAQILADAKVIPEEFVPVDQTPGGTLEDTEKPESEAAQEQARVEQTAPTEEQPAAPIDQAVKSRIDQFDAALKEFKAAIAEKEGFDESKHPRDDEGKFTFNGGGGESSGGGGARSAGHGTSGSGYSGRGVAVNDGDAVGYHYTTAEFDKFSGKSRGAVYLAATPDSARRGGVSGYNERYLPPGSGRTLESRLENERTLTVHAHNLKVFGDDAPKAMSPEQWDAAMDKLSSTRNQSEHELLSSLTTGRPSALDEASNVIRFTDKVKPLSYKVAEKPGIQDAVKKLGYNSVRVFDEGGESLAVLDPSLLEIRDVTKSIKAAMDA